MSDNVLSHLINYLIVDLRGTVILMSKLLLEVQLIQQRIQDGEICKDKDIICDVNVLFKNLFF